MGKNTWRALAWVEVQLHFRDLYPIGKCCHKAYDVVRAERAEEVANLVPRKWASELERQTVHLPWGSRSSLHVEMPATATSTDEIETAAEAEGVAGETMQLAGCALPTATDHVKTTDDIEATTDPDVLVV